MIVERVVKYTYDVVQYDRTNIDEILDFVKKTSSGGI